MEKAEILLKKFSINIFFQRNSLIKGLFGIINLIRAKEKSNKNLSQIFSIKSLMFLKKAINYNDDLKEIFLGYLIQLRPLLKRGKDIKNVRNTVFNFARHEPENIFAQQFWLEYMTIYEPTNAFLLKLSQSMVALNSENFLIEENLKDQPFELFLFYTKKIEYGDESKSTWYKFNVCLKTLFINSTYIDQKRIPHLEWWRNVFFQKNFSKFTIKERKNSCSFLFGFNHPYSQGKSLFPRGLLYLSSSITNDEKYLDKNINNKTIVVKNNSLLRVKTKEVFYA